MHADTVDNIGVRDRPEDISKRDLDCNRWGPGSVFTRVLEMP
jgi:hypothetical protein